MLLAPHRQVRHSIDSSIIGTPMPSAAAPYRASGLVHWHFCDMPTASSNVRVRAQSGKHMLMLSSSLFDRSGHCAAMEFKRKLVEVDRSARQRVWDRTTVPR